MRTIKFRGKFVYANPDGSLKWVYGDFRHSAVHGKALIYENIPYEGRNFSTQQEVLIGTIGQFTGVHDKNGIDIYEHDIIRTFDSKGEPMMHEIYYLDSESRFATKLIGYDFLTTGNLTQKWVDEIGFEVIGNIFDNPELIYENKN